MRRKVAAVFTRNKCRDFDVVDEALTNNFCVIKVVVALASIFLAVDATGPSGECTITVCVGGFTFQMILTKSGSALLGGSAICSGFARGP